MINYFEKYSLENSAQLYSRVVTRQKIIENLQDTKKIINNDFPDNDLWVECYPEKVLETTKPESSLPRIQQGTQFIADSELYESVCTLTKDCDGYTKLDESIIRNKKTNDLQFIKYSTESLRAKVLEIHDKSIIAEVYYDDHESEQEFNEIFKDILEEANLLEQGSLFEIVTERHRNGFSVDVRAVSEDLSEEDKLLFLEIMKDRNNKC